MAREGAAEVNMRAFLCLASILALAACGNDEAPTSEGAVLVGTMESALVQEAGKGDHAGAFELTINGDPHAVEVDADGSFVVRSMPTGDLIVTVRIAGISGQLHIEGVHRGEIVQVTIQSGPGALQISVVRRDAPPVAEVEHLLPVHGEKIEIKGNGTVFMLEPAIYAGPIELKGNDVTLIGWWEGTCDPALRTVITGPLEVKGNGARLIDVDIEGALEVKGNNAEIFTHCP